MKVLLVIDMQKDFIDGSLGTKEAEGIVGNVAEYISNFEGQVIYTMDTHPENYLDTLEGKKLPVKHCIKNTPGWEISEEIPIVKDAIILEKPTFGSIELAGKLKELNDTTPISDITVIGLCTDICVISNALLSKAVLPEVEVQVVANCCAGVTVASHNNALEAMKMCQINII